MFYGHGRYYSKRKPGEGYTVTLGTIFRLTEELQNFLKIRFSKNKTTKSSAHYKKKKKKSLYVGDVSNPKDTILYRAPKKWLGMKGKM